MTDKEQPTDPSATPPVEEPRDRPAPRPGRVPQLEPEDDFGAKAPRLRDLDAEIEQELRDAMGDLSDKEMYGEPARGARSAPQPGPKKGRVIRVHGNDVFLDLPGGRSQGVLPALQFPEGPPAVGTEVEVTIEGYDNANGLLLLSRRGAAVVADWSTVAANMTVEARVTATNKGGLAVEVNGIRGFMPISQIDLYRVETPEQYVNQKLLCLVTEVNPEERNLVVSRRALLEREREEAREKLWKELAEGQVRPGVVRSVKDFGAFVDLGGVDGLLHVSEMSWQRVQDPTTIVQPGQAIRVIVLKIDPERRKVSLGLKQLTASPWDNIQEKYPPGSAVRGTVTRLMDFGAFVELEPAVEGLIHVSELAPQRVRRVSDIVKPGQEVQVQVLSVDPNQRRIGLSLKAALAKAAEQAAPEEEPEEEPAEVKPPRPRTTPLRGGLGSH
ncbi:MAG TPA: S1 RNA-binding domain-containing protein, partial [Gemmataceae bacterium]|nr:S1 RNA-binding domain-containing protein [Gemmataceae bacterium]